MNIETVDIAQAKVADIASHFLNGFPRMGKFARESIDTQLLKLKSSATTSDDVMEIRKNVAEAVEYFEKILRTTQFDLKFSIDDSSKSIVIRLYEKGTEKLIRQIPPDEILRLRQRMSELLGAIYDSTV